MLEIKNIKEAGDLAGKKVIARLDLNVPIENDQITDDFRILKLLPTIQYLRENGAITLIISHLDAEGETLEVIGNYLNEKFPITFLKDLFSAETEKKIQEAKAGDVFLFENIRQYPEEEKNDEEFAKRIARLGDLYLNDAFPVCHRCHASVVGVPKFLPHYAGFQLQKEIEHLSLSENPERPFLFILGGAKFSTKLPLIQKFLDRADYCFVAGALSNDFFKEKGWEVGISLTDPTPFDPKMLENPKLILPAEVMTKNGDQIVPKKPSELNKEDKIVDAGPAVLEQLRELIQKSKLIIWNGPLGYYEDGFDQPTKDLAKLIAESVATSIIGGGDTIAAIESLGLQDKFTFVSTGGGAMLDFLLDDTLPGIEALK
ncbi:MAG TPA: phosphoglycerate kinase [Candidatus Paceibacterota bacterium]|nr:phosphoglycerate kinase [Candidatus Paceibacterota bacterium]